MKGPAIDRLVYEFMFPKPKSTDPPNFQLLLQRQLVPEVRLETQAFYGHLSSQEAKYPGLDYSYQPHRARLSRYPWHRRLFRAFDNLGLTESEIAGLTKWEGTRWAKERFEREQGIVIRDTTADGIADWIEPSLRVPETSLLNGRNEMDEFETIHDDSLNRDLETEQRPEHEDDQYEDQNDEGESQPQIDEDADEDSDSEIQSVGVALNERLRAAVAQREAGNASTVMDEEWEQWFKDAVEASGLPFLSTNFPHANIPGTRPSTESQVSSIPPRLLHAARLEQWHSIPDVLHSIIRQHTDNPPTTTITTTTSGAINMQMRDTPSPQLLASSTPSVSSSHRSGSSSSPFFHRTNMISSPRRPYSNPALEPNPHIRRWESQRTPLRSDAAPRLAHVSAIRSTQNQSGNNSRS